MRVSLNKFVVVNRLSTEDVITIEYMPAISISDESESVEVPAWIGSIDTQVEGVIIAGCYDGKIQIIDKNGFEVACTVGAHEEPVRAITSWNTVRQNVPTTMLATASKDNSLKCWTLNKSKAGAHELVLAANLVVRFCHR